MCIRDRLEPARFSAQDPKSCVSANFTISANFRYYTKGFFPVSYTHLIEYAIVYTGTTEIKWDDKTTKTIYTDVGFSGYALLALPIF